MVDVYPTAQMPIGINAPDRYSSKMQRHRRAVWTWNGEFVSATHAGQLVIGREYRLFRHPVNFESRSVETRCDISANRRLALQHGLSRENEHRIVAPVRHDLFHIFPSGS